MANVPYFRIYASSYTNTAAFHLMSPFSIGVFFKLLVFASQTGGHLVKGENKTPLDIDAIGMLVGCQRDAIGKAMGDLLDAGYIKKQENETYIIPHLIEEARDYENYILGKKRASEAGNKARWGDVKPKKESKLHNTSQRDAKGMLLGVPNESQTCPHSHLHLPIYNKKNITQARAREGSSEEEKNGYAIEPPPGMPKSLEEAISMGALAGASETFVRDRAYPQALACGWMMDGNRTIRNFGAWAKLFEDNSKNAQKRKEVADRKAVKPAKTLGERRMEAEPWLYDKDIKVREL